MLEISLAVVRESGAVASLRNDEGELMDIIRRSLERNPQKICGEAAAYLRELADAFELLADDPQPFQAASQRKAMRAAASRANMSHSD